MDGFQIDPPSVVTLADVFEAQRPPFEALGNQLRQAAQGINSGSAEVDGQTRAAMDGAKDRFAQTAEVYEAVTDVLDASVRRYLATEDQLNSEQQELLSKLRAPRPEGPGTS
jgi:hypothetical protein